MPHRMVNVIIPWRDSGCLHRAASLAWVLEQWARHHPTWAVTVATSQAEEWVKADAVMPAIAALGCNDIAIVADADVWSDHVTEAVDAAQSGDCWWAVPHLHVRRLTSWATDEVRRGADTALLNADSIAESAYVGVLGGGMVVAPRDVLLDCPLDPRFVGWGGEDHAWGYALSTLHGMPWRGDAPLWHLWHPPQRRATRRWGSHASEALRLRYHVAREQPDAMAQIIDEAKQAATWPSHASH